MAKRKATLVSIDDDDLEDGSGSDNSSENYLPRPGFERVEHIPDEAISVARDGRIRSMFSTVPIPASPSKKKNPIVLNPDLAQPERDSEMSQGWQPDSDFAAFDAEYGTGLDKGPRQARSSVSAVSKIVRRPVLTIMVG
jgi:hypothetical protein